MIFSLKIEIIKLVRAENTPNLHTLFKKHPETKGLKTFTETQEAHRQGGVIVPLCLF